MYDNHTNCLICTSFKEINLNNQLKIEPKAQNVSIKNFVNYSILSEEDRIKCS